MIKARRGANFKKHNRVSMKKGLPTHHFLLPRQLVLSVFAIFFLEHSTLYQHIYMCPTLSSSINIAFWKWLYISATHRWYEFYHKWFHLFPLLIFKLFPVFVNDTMLDMYHFTLLHKVQLTHHTLVVWCHQAYLFGPVLLLDIREHHSFNSHFFLLWNAQLFLCLRTVCIFFPINYPMPTNLLDS